MTWSLLKTSIQTYLKYTESNRNIDIYYVGYITMKNLDYVNIHSVNPLYLIFDKIDGYIEESNGNKYLIFAPTNKNKEIHKIHRTLG